MESLEDEEVSISVTMVEADLYVAGLMEESYTSPTGVLRGFLYRDEGSFFQMPFLRQLVQYFHV